MTPPDQPPSNPYDPNWPKPEVPDSSGPAEPPTQPQPGAGNDPYVPYGQQQPFGQAPYGQAPQAPYGQAPQAPWGQPQGQTPYGAPIYGAPIASHPSATTAMVLGIGSLAGMFICGIPILLAPFAWFIGGRAVKEIDAAPGRYSGRDQAQAGRIMGMIGTVLLALVVIAIIALILIGVFASDDLNNVEHGPDPSFSTSDPAF